MRRCPFKGKLTKKWVGQLPYLRYAFPLFLRRNIHPPPDFRISGLARRTRLQVVLIPLFKSNSWKAQNIRRFFLIYNFIYSQCSI